MLPSTSRRSGMFIGSTCLSARYIGGHMGSPVSAPCLQRPLHLLGHVGAGSGRGLLVDRRAGKAAVAGRAVEVARGVDEVEHRANRLRAVADLVGRQVQMNAAVAVSLASGRVAHTVQDSSMSCGSRPVISLAHSGVQSAPTWRGSSTPARDVLRAVGQRHLVLASRSKSMPASSNSQ